MKCKYYLNEEECGECVCKNCVHTEECGMWFDCTCAGECDAGHPNALLKCNESLNNKQEIN